MVLQNIQPMSVLTMKWPFSLYFFMLLLLFWMEGPEFVSCWRSPWSTLDQWTS